MMQSKHMLFALLITVFVGPFTSSNNKKLEANMGPDESGRIKYLRHDCYDDASSNLRYIAFALAAGEDHQSILIYDAFLDIWDSVNIVQSIANSYEVKEWFLDEPLSILDLRDLSISNKGRYLYIRSSIEDTPGIVGPGNVILLPTISTNLYQINRKNESALRLTNLLLEKDFQRGHVDSFALSNRYIYSIIDGLYDLELGFEYPDFPSLTPEYNDTLYKKVVSGNGNSVVVSKRWNGRAGAGPWVYSLASGNYLETLKSIDGSEFPLFRRESLFLSETGRYSVWNGADPNVDPGEFANHLWFMDNLSGKTQLISQSDSVQMGDFFSRPGTVSENGRYVAFSSAAGNLIDSVPDDGSRTYDLFIRDMALQKIVQITKDNAVSNVKISADGQFVIYCSIFSPDGQIIENENAGVLHTYIYDRAGLPFSPLLTINYQTARSGSYLTLNGETFAPDSTVQLIVNGRFLEPRREAAIQVDDQGAFEATIATDLANDGIYVISVDGQPLTKVTLRIDDNYSVRDQESDGALLSIQSGTALDQHIFLPMARK
ncbi:MAG: hypothetical protein AAF902_01025 [Chloroflexota bacterium]